MGLGIVIGIPHLKGLDGFFFDTMLALSRPQAPVGEARMLRVENKPVDLARNMLVEAALSWPEMTHLLMVDSDMRIPEDALFRLIQDDKDIVSGTYFARSNPPIPHLYEFHHQDNLDGTCPLGRDHGDGVVGRWYRPYAKELSDFYTRHPEYDDSPETAVLPRTPDCLMPIDGAGAGILLIKRHVLEALEWPWFKCHERSAGGEDFYFLEKAKAAGFQAWGDLSVQCQHEYRGIFMDHKDFRDCFKLGTPEAATFEDPPIVDMYPQPAVHVQAPVKTQSVSEAG